MKQYNLLIAEDDLNLGQILKEYLELKGYNSVLARDGQEAVEEFDKHQFDLCILDIMMPKKDGFMVSKEIRAKNPQIPFIFLTARSQQEDTLKGLQMGADDYIKKPFSMEELNLRLLAILRRADKGELKRDRFTIGNFEFDYTSQKLEYDGTPQKLTSKEASLLLLLCQSKNKILDRSAALKIIWGDDSYFNSRSMDVYITKLRKLLSRDEKVKILTIHGEGFRLVV
ncbi:MAG: response regulator transcription factor, partial [Bacteroidota bacterium]